ncbi:homing endonuclease isoform A [Chlorella sorokiniana]|uniref:Homing endonuclease isoform A n=1 Tax=Chlorella sorokiniana TaxID=3076 RepID=A0A2P6TWY7_CHLSO|nr:homing endonuclease isoform A [Chlorella sorokiniana]|eukprot:PRW58580.1 homing endonuclease isoform A [Chlorella sorokiniana]
MAAAPGLEEACNEAGIPLARCFGSQEWFDAQTGSADIYKALQRGGAPVPPGGDMSASEFAARRSRLSRFVGSSSSELAAWVGRCCSCTFGLTAAEVAVALEQGRRQRIASLPASPTPLQRRFAESALTADISFIEVDEAARTVEAALGLEEGGAGMPPCVLSAAHPVKSMTPCLYTEPNFPGVYVAPGEYVDLLDAALVAAGRRAELLHAANSGLLASRPGELLMKSHLCHSGSSRCTNPDHVVVEVEWKKRQRTECGCHQRIRAGEACGCGLFPPCGKDQCLAAMAAAPGLEEACNEAGIPLARCFGSQEWFDAQTGSADIYKALQRGGAAAPFVPPGGDVSASEFAARRSQLLDAAASISPQLAELVARCATDPHALTALEAAVAAEGEQWRAGALPASPTPLPLSQATSALTADISYLMVDDCKSALRIAFGIQDDPKGAPGVLVAAHSVKSMTPCLAAAKFTGMIAMGPGMEVDALDVAFVAAGRRAELLHAANSRLPGTKPEEQLVKTHLCHFVFSVCKNPDHVVVEPESNKHKRDKRRCDNLIKSGASCGCGVFPPCGKNVPRG